MVSSSPATAAASASGDASRRGGNTNAPRVTLLSPPPHDPSSITDSPPAVLQVPTTTSSPSHAHHPAPTTSSDAYALVRTGPALSLPPCDGGSGGGSDGGDNGPSSRISTQGAVRCIYESYSLRYPNPAVLADRFSEAERLAAEARRSQEASGDGQGDGGGGGGGGGFFSRLFGGGRAKKRGADATHASNADQNSGGDLTEQQEGHADGVAEESAPADAEQEREEQEAELGRYNLCGTDAFAVGDIIPEEAHRAARFQLASSSLGTDLAAAREQEQKGCTLRVCRTGNVASYGVVSGVVGWGQIAEFHRVPKPLEQVEEEGNEEDGYEQQPSLSFTSDADLLEPSIAAYERYQSPSGDNAAASTEDDPPPDLRRVRAAALGPNSLAISWGCRDGIVVLYRRSRSEKTGMRWDAVGCIEPNMAVGDAAAASATVPPPDLQSGGREKRKDTAAGKDRAAQQKPMTPSPFALDTMRVADLVPMVLDDDEETCLLGEESDNSATIMLAISRLGGYIELVPIPTDLCRGPIIKTQKPPKRKGGGSGTGGSRPEHYSASLPVLRVPSAAAISTSAYHRDVTALDVHRTVVSATTEWDCDARPDAPPVEFLLAASGASNGGKGECVTLWGVASVYSAPEAADPRNDGAGSQQRQQQQQQEMEFSIHVGLVGIIDVLNVGSPVSVFASEITTKQWYRRPERNIRRRISRGDDVGRAVIPSSPTDEMRPRICSISTSVPFTALQFAPRASYQSPLLLCGLDYNGGVTVLNCTAAHRVAIHQAPPPTRPNSPGDDSGPAVDIVAIDILRSRETIMDWTDNCDDALIQAGWWWPDSDENTEEYMSPQQPLLMTLSSGGELNAYALDMLITDAHTDTGASRVAFQGYCTMRGAIDGRISISNSVCFSSSSLDSGPFGFLVLSSTTELCSTAASPAEVQRQLVPCAAQTLDPAKLIYSLMDRGQNREAIEMTRRLAGFTLSPEVMDICYKALWIDEFDADALLQVSDAHYVIQAARSLGDQFSTASTSSKSRRIPLTLGQVLKIYRYAIEMATPHSNAFYDKATLHLRSYLVKAGTYALLSQQFGSDLPTLKVGRFFSTFLRPGAVLDVALSCAKRGDIRCLALLFVRHSDEIGSNQMRAQILAQLPLGLSVGDYSYLLPFHENESGDMFSYDDNERGPPTSFHAWQLASRLENDDAGMIFYLDEQDKLITVDQMRLNYTDGDEDTGATRDANGGSSSFDLSQWFGERAQQIHTLSGLLEPAVNLCSFGLKRLHEDDPGRQRLSSFCATAHHLNQIINDDSLLLDDEASSLSITSFAGLGFQGAVRLVLGADTATSTGDDNVTDAMIARYRKLLEPMILSDDIALRMHHWSSNHDGEVEAMQRRMQHEITSFCIANLHKSSYDPKLLCRSLEICRAFADASKTVIPKNERIIRDENDLVSFVIQVAYSPQVRISRSVLDTLWGLYECLPVRVKSRETSDDLWAKMSSTIDEFYRHLLVFEIGLRWCLDPQILGTLHDLQQSASSIEFGCNILAAMSDAFCDRIKSLPSSEQEENEAILDFLSDLQEMNDMCFDSALPVGAELENYIVRTLLYQHSFRALRIIITTKNNWFDEDFVQGAISEFVLEIMAPTDQNDSSPGLDGGAGPARGDLLRAAIDCQDVFGPIFPKLCPDFDTSRRYLDVAHFVHDVLGCKLQPADDSIGGGEGRLGPIASLLAFQSTPAIEIIDAVLRENPDAMLLGGSDWRDAAFSSQANFDVACYFERIDAPLDPSENLAPLDASKLPPPPGGCIMQLSSILGLGENSMIARAKMAQHGAGAGFFGASSAICFLLLRDISMTQKTSKPLDDSEITSSLLEAIAIIVSSESYADIRMKRELCILTIRHLSINITKSGFGRNSFDVVLRAFPALEAKFSSLNAVHSDGEAVAATRSFDSNEGQHIADSLPGNASGPPMPPQRQEQTSQFLVFKAAGMISRQAKKVVNEVKKSGDIVHYPSTPHDASHGGSNLHTVLAPSISDTQKSYGQIFLSTSMNVHELMTKIQSTSNNASMDPNLSDDDKSVLKGVARNILFWCAIEAGKARPNGLGPASTFNQIAKMLQMGLALLLELSDEHRLGILDDTERSLNAEVTSFVSMDFGPPFKPDDALVRQLCGRGYSLNGARRAAVKTNNADFNTALTWCVTHFQDRDFSEPLIFLKADAGTSPDRHLVAMVQKAITESRRGQVLATSAPSTGVQPQPPAGASSKKPPLSSTDIINESGFSFGWDEDDDLGDMLEDDNDEVQDTAPSLGSAAPSSSASQNALPSKDITAEALTPQLPKAAETSDSNGWDGFDDFDDLLDDEDKRSPSGDAIETVQSDGKDQGGNQDMSPMCRSPMRSKSDDAPISRSLPSVFSPASSNEDGGDGDEGGWDEDGGLDNFDDILNEKYGDEDAATHQEAESVSIPTPAAPVPAPMQVEVSAPSIAAGAAAEAEETKTAEVKLGPPPSSAPATKVDRTRPSSSPPASISKAINPVAKPPPPSPAPQPPTSRSIPPPSPGLKSNSSKLMPTPPPKSNTTKSNETTGSTSAVSKRVSRPLPLPPPPRRLPPAQPKIAPSLGQSPIRTVREQSQRLGEEERKRMAEEGRRLLREKRLAQQSKSSSTTGLPSDSSALRPTTRSMTSRTTTTGAIPTSRPTTATAGRAGAAARITDPSERERLIMEGRRLLQEARKTKKNEAVGVTAVTPRPRLKPTPPPRRSPPPSTVPAPPPPLPTNTPPAQNSIGKTEKAGDEDDNWDDFDKF